MYQYSSKSSMRLFIQYLIIVFLIIIASLIYYNIQNENNIQIDIEKHISSSTDTITGETDKIINSQKKISNKPIAPCNCPSVDDIVSGIFPGRNTGLVSGGNAFDINASDNLFETTPEYQYFETQNAFPNNSPFDLNDTPLTKNNPYSRSNNTYSNTLQDTQTTDESANIYESRMDKGIFKNDDNKNKNKRNSSTRSKNPILTDNP